MTHFILRRLYSIISVVSLGFFLLSYLYLHSKPLGPGGREAYDTTLQNLQSVPFSAVLVWLFVFIPLIFLFFHLIVTVGPPAKPFRVWFYRPAGVLGILFIGYHFFLTRIISPGYEGFAAIFLSPVNGAIYFAGVACLAFYFTQSVWHVLIQWGVTVSPHSKRAVLIFSWCLFAVLVGVNGLIVLNDSFPETAPASVNVLLNFVRNVLFL